MYQNIEEQVRTEAGMSIGEMCALAQVSRAGYYRFLTTPAAGDKDIDLRDAVRRIALEVPAYGRPRMTEELHRQGWQVGQTGCIALCEKRGPLWGLLCLRSRRRVVRTR